MPTEREVQKFLASIGSKEAQAKKEMREAMEAQLSNAVELAGNEGWKTLVKELEGQLEAARGKLLGVTDLHSLGRTQAEIKLLSYIIGWPAQQAEITKEILAGEQAE